MGKDKRLHLAFDLQKAPLEVKSNATKHHQNLLRVEKAEAQMKLWYQELVVAKKEFSASGDALDKSLESWDPQATTVKEEKK